MQHPPYSVLEILKNVTPFRGHVHVAYGDLARRSDDEYTERQLKDRLAQDMARKFADTAIQSGRWLTRREHNGMAAQVEAYCLDFDQLVDLLAKAYDQGRSEFPRFVK